MFSPFMSGESKVRFWSLVGTLNLEHQTLNSKICFKLVALPSGSSISLQEMIKLAVAPKASAALICGHFYSLCLGELWVRALFKPQFISSLFGSICDLCITKQKKSSFKFVDNQVKTM